MNQSGSAHRTSQKKECQHEIGVPSSGQPGPLWRKSANTETDAERDKKLLNICVPKTRRATREPFPRTRLVYLVDMAEHSNREYGLGRQVGLKEKVVHELAGARRSVAKGHREGFARLQAHAVERDRQPRVSRRGRDEFHRPAARVDDLDA